MDHLSFNGFIYGSDSSIFQQRKDGLLKPSFGCLGSMQWVSAYKDVLAPLLRARSRHIQIS
jgi:hypothetical protein